MQAILVLLKGATVQQKVFLSSFPAVIGRSANADIELNDAWASRFHCEISLSRGTLVVRDLRSRHGTLVNGCHVETAPLMPGDQLVIGMSLLRVVYERYTLDPAPPTVYATSPAIPISCGLPHWQT